ncbi:MAG TPA: DUF3134 domain-containing protein [Oscillatoriaceae cyanobacterium M33_DOE_052]|uniref:DUF3134 domain-containing protein n=1 Tax=Planktothricoides sp. SpSt-374 TaxID=2282167 RepID=A0A7C3ZKS5_9CYAN|nr:DUF3134 domain-containing protein [Oscillatoriaceae cyanobacterium M33_DOE_052]
MRNPSLTQQPRYKPAEVIRSQQQPSILDWLESSGRLLARDPSDEPGYGEEEEEISELMSVDDGGYEEEEMDLDDADID